MADIITFTPRERGAESRREELAEIVIFPGVRYERAEHVFASDDEPSQSQARGRRNRRRN